MVKAEALACTINSISGHIVASVQVRVCKIANLDYQLEKDQMLPLRKLKGFAKRVCEAA